MREILFRGKRTDNNQWVYSGTILSLIDKNTENISSCITLSSAKVYMPKGNSNVRISLFNDNITKMQCCFYEVDSKTVGRYTGLTDKNGVKIFEGDIVDILAENEEIGTIVFDEGAFIVSADGFCLDFQNNIDSTNLEVIGNIYDNPELLKERENNG